MQYINVKATKQDRAENIRVAKANAKAARELRRKADVELAQALASIDQMDASESFKAQETVRRLMKRYEGCNTPRQVDAVYHDEKRKNANIEWFAPINSAFRGVAFARVTAAAA